MNLWKHGKYLDLWSVVHFLSGLTLALTFVALSLSLFDATLLTAAILIAWELFEWVIGIIEPSVNVTVDLIVGALGFFLGSYWHYLLGHPFSPTVFSALLIILFTLSAWGFLDFYFRGYR